MKKQLFTTLVAVLMATLGMAQAVLPTAWSFSTTTLPTGWTSAGTGFGYYSGSGNPSPAAKFSVTGDMLTINFATTPGTIAYDIADNPPTGQTYSSNFILEQSADNVTYTTVATYSAQANFGAATGTYYSKAATALNSTTRYVRFHLVTKAVGNIGLDNVNITAGVSTAAEILVQQGTNNVTNGGTYSFSSPVSTMTPVTFTVKNLGTVSTLSVTSAALSGPAASDYSVTTTMPLNVSASSSGNLVVNFTPSSAGTRNAVLTLSSNDPTNNPYVINLNGIGGNLATEPTAQATNLSFPMSKSYHIQGNFVAASPAADGYLVLRKTGSAVTDVPVDGVVYQRGDMIGSSQVVYSSSANGFFPNNIVASTTYYFAVFAYNGVSTYRNYLVTSPLTGSVTTSGSMQATLHPTYYNSVNTANSTFVTDLHSAVTTHTAQYYSSFGNYVAATFYTRDTAADKRVITCVYSGENIVYTEPFDWTTYNMSREHTYCESWMPTYSCTVYHTLPEYNDYHLITPTDQNNVNAIRSNYPLGVVVGTPSYTFNGCKLGNDASGHKVFEPRDVDKGDAARHMLYECIAYTGITPSCTPLNTSTTWGGSWSLPSICYTGVPYGQDQNVLKQWNYQDPPDNFEIALNDFIDSLQGNRNPFVDHSEYVCYIDFSNMTYLSTPSSPCAAVGFNEIPNANGSALIYPNPANSSFTVLIGENTNAKANVSIMNAMGEQVAALANLDNNNGVINCTDLHIANGLYVVKITVGGKTFVSHAVINK